MFDEPAAAAGDATLVGRGLEQAELRALVDRLRSGDSVALVLRGEPGIGKTALLDHVARSALGVRVRGLAGLESESHLGFGAIHRLLIPHLSEIEGLPAMQSQALRTAIGLSSGPPANAFLLGLGVLTLLEQAARDEPLLLVIDDAHWLDAESLEILGFVARRLYAERVGLLFAVREPVSEPVLEGVPSFHLAGLTPTESIDLLMRIASDQVDRQVAERVAAKARGNPLLIREIGRELTDEDSTWDLLLDEPVPIGERLEHHFRLRIERLPEPCRLVLLLAAAHPDSESTVIRRAAAQQGLDPDAINDAIAAGLVVAHPEFAFRHPVIRSAVYASAPASDRRAAHVALVQAMGSEGKADLRAWHLAAAATEPDEAVAAELERGARVARARGGFLSESAFLARAADLTPDPARRAVRVLSAARAALTGEAPLRAQALLDAEVLGLEDDFLQAQVRKLRANALHRAGAPGHDAPAVLLRSARVFEPFDRELARETMLEALEQVFIRGELMVGTTAEEIGEAALAMASGEDTVADLLLRALGSHLSRDPVEAAPLLRKAAKALRVDGSMGEQVPRWFALGQFVAQFLWDDRAARDWLTRCEALARRTGAIEYLLMTLTPLSWVEAGMGRFAESEARMEEVRELSRTVGVDEEQVAQMSNAGLLAWQGREEDARAAADLGRAIGEVVGAGLYLQLSRTALITLELGLGNYEDAFGLAAGMMRARNPGVPNSVAIDLVEAATRSDHMDVARLTTDELRLRIEAVRTPSALGLLARCEALVAGQHEAAREHFEESLAQLTRADLPLELARTRLLYGEWLRRQRRRSEARDQLRRAQTTFRDLGAAAFANRASTELRATGEHESRTSNGLTAQEAEIARLAAGGATNHEIGAQLFISTHTVEYHLRKVFRKLDLTSRHKLRESLDL